MKGDFREDLLSAKRDPLDAPVQDFDWERLDARLSEDAASGDNDKLLAETITRLLQAVIPQRERYLPPLTVGINVIALAWVISPAYFEGAPSLRQLAKRCGIPAATLARHTARYSRLLRWRNRAQQHAWNFQRSPSGDGEEPGGEGGGEGPASSHEDAPGQ